MSLLKKSYTSKDYWNLPDGQRAELIDGQFYNMAPPSRIHQEISYQISRFLGNKIVGLSLDADTEGEGSRYEQRITESHVFPPSVEIGQHSFFKAYTRRRRIENDK